VQPHLLKLSATKIVNLSLIEKAHKNGKFLYVTFYGNKAEVVYFDEEAELLWSYLDGISFMKE
jgi:hypothetical protein